MRPRFPAAHRSTTLPCSWDGEQRSRGIVATDLAPLENLPAAHRGERRLHGQRSNEREELLGYMAAPEALRHSDKSAAASRLGAP